MLTGHITQNQIIVIGEPVFQKMTPAQRDVLIKAAREAGDFQNQVIDKVEADDLAKLKAGGMQVVRPDVAAFRAAAANACREPALERRIGRGFLDKLETAQR